MLKVFHCAKGLNRTQLLTVYRQSILDEGKYRYAYLPQNLQMMRAEEDFLGFVDLFLADERTMYAVWVIDCIYSAALRIEPYKDGYLLSGLETAPTARCKGYASSLLKSMQQYLMQFGPCKIYSHVDKANKTSWCVHMNCDFVRVLEHVVYVDGSVSHNACTLCYER